MPVKKSNNSSQQSGIISLPVKVLKQNFANRLGAYPTTNRTGDADRSGKFNVSFDDTNTVIFTDVTNNLAFPSLTLSGSNLNINSIATPNVAGSLISSSGRTRSGITDRKNGDYKWLAFDRSTNESLSLFDDSRIFLGTTNFYLTGTSKSVIDGFNGKLSNKTQIKIDLPNTEEIELVRSPKSRFNSLDPGGKFFQKDRTGFVYYNFDLSRWEQIGLVNFATSSPEEYDIAVDVTTSTFNSGTNRYPSQFSATPVVNKGTSFNTNAWNNGGYPINSSFAPQNTKYYATSSQVLKMSNYISHPFLLEKVVVDVPFEAEWSRIGTNIGSVPLGVIKKQQDHVFFMYRQSYAGSTDKNGRHEYPAQVTRTNRFLICSGVMAFYTNFSKDSTGANVNNFEPLNSPSFSFDYDFSAADVKGTVTGSARLEITPAIVSGQHLTHEIRPTAPGTGGGITINNFWLGGNAFEGNFSFGGTKTGPGNVYTVFDANGTTGINDYSETFSNLQHQKLFDSRYQKMFGHVKEYQKSSDEDASAQGIVSGSRQVLSPYLLLPTDRLIFGFDTPFSLHASQASNRANEITGSFMKLITDRQISVTLFGSLIRNKNQFNDTLNQNLTSESVNESLLSDQRYCLDQFNIQLVDSYRDNYLDHAHQNNVGASAASFIGSAVSANIGKIKRFVKIIDNSEIFHESLQTNGGKNFAVVRYDKAGAIADKLEQRLFARFDKKSTITSGPLSIKFGIRNNNNEIELLRTDEILKNTFISSNIDIFATCSLPFVDDNSPINRVYEGNVNNIVEF